MKQTRIKSFRLKNFKAVLDSKTVKFSPLTVLIGNNGSGKSSLIEGLETLQAIVLDGLDEAMYRWRGFEHIRHYQARQRQKPIPRFAKGSNSHDKARFYQTDPLSFSFRTTIGQAQIDINQTGSDNELFIQYEKVRDRKQLHLERDAGGWITLNSFTPDDFSDIILSLLPNNGSSAGFRLRNGDSLLRYTQRFASFIKSWQFLSINAWSMGNPIPQKRTGGPIHLNKDGSNIAEYLLSIRNLDAEAFEGIIETLQAVLPYASDLQPTLTSELERTVYLQLTEGEFKVPGWLLSTGTLRILAILALLRHPSPPPLIVIEEIENGLDPRTIHLIVEEIQSAVEAGITQIVLTTHSPYLLDLLPLSSIVLVERVNGKPTFIRPADQESLQEWGESFMPGQLYTMGQLSRVGAL